MAINSLKTLKLRSIDLPRKDFRDFEPAEKSVLKASSDLNLGGSTGPLLEGEFVKFNASGKLVRALDEDENTPYAKPPVFLVVGGAGRLDNINIGKVTVYYGSGGLEFDTKLFKTGAGISYAPGDSLTVGSVSFDGDVTFKSAFKKPSSDEPVYAYVVRAPSADGFLRVRLA